MGKIKIWLQSKKEYGGMLILEKRDYHRGEIIRAIITVLFLCSIVVTFVHFDLSSKVLDHVSYVSNNDEEQFVYEFVEGMEISQQFSCYEDFDFITVSFNHHDSVTQGKIFITISFLFSVTIK